MYAKKSFPMTLQNQSEQEPLQFVEAFQRAEAAIKAAENSVYFDSKETGSGVDKKGLFIPAINELRYAGYHIADYIKSGSDSSVRKAISHCIRAEHDVYDCQITFFLRECQKFQDDYRTVVIAPVIPDFSNLNQRLQEVKSGMTSRDWDYEQTIERKRVITKEIGDIYYLFQASRDELNKLVAEKLRQEAREDAREKRNLRQNIVIAIISASVGALVSFICSSLH